MEAHGSVTAKAAQTVVGLLPDALAQKAMEHAGVDRLAVLTSASRPSVAEGPSR